MPIRFSLFITTVLTHVMNFNIKQKIQVYFLNVNLPLVLGDNVTDFDGCPSPIFVEAVTQNS